MSKKFTMLLMSLLCFMGVAKAQYYVIESIGDNVTDLSALEEDSYVALYNVGKSKYIYEGTDYKMYMGSEAPVGAGHEYIWQVHKEGENFLFSSLSGKYISTPLDGQDVYTVASDNEAKDQFAITAHSEDATKWKLQSTNNTNIYWDAQDGRFVGWQGSGANSQYEIRPVTVSTLENDFTKLLTLDENDIKWFVIKNVRQQKLATYAGDEAIMTQQTDLTAASLFYFTGRATADLATVRIHSYAAGDKLCAAYNSWTDAGIEWYLKNQATGVSICTSTGEWNAWNDASGGGQVIGYWSASDAGSAWELVSDFTEYITLAKAAAVSEIENLSKISAIYPAATEAKAALDAITGTDAAAWMAVNEVLVNYKKSVNGKNVRLTTYGRNASDGHDLTAVSAGGTATTNSADAGIWTLISNADGTFKMYNFVSNLYLGATRGQSQRVLTYESSADAASYTFNATTDESNVVNLWNNGNTLHMDGSANIVQWNDNAAGASIWKVVSCEPIAISREQYDAAVEAKDALPYAVQEAYGLVTDAANYYSNYKSDAEGSYAALLDNAEGTYFHSAYNSEPGDGSGVHYIQADLGAGNSIDEFYFYMKPRSGNGNNRPKNITVYGSNDINGEFTKIADVTTTLDGSMNPYLSAKLGTDGTNYRYIRLTVTSTNTGSKFFTLSELYFFPANSDVTSLVDSYNAFSQASITSNDFAEAASALLDAETVLALSNIKKEAYALLNTNEGNHAENPNLGQYTTEAYNALVAACEANDATEESIREAIAAFKASKNLPVFTISNGDVKDYAVGKSIYDNNSGTLYFKATNVFDKTMWWALDQTTTTVGVTENVGIYNVGTGNGFWGASSIKVAETSDAVEGDGLFLFYTTGNNTPIHFQNDNQQIVRWSSTESTSGSAAKFTYVGSTYELNQLADELFTEAAALAAINVPNFDFADGVNKYSGDKDALDAAVANRATILSKLSTVDDIVAAKTQLETAIAGVRLNMPVEGHYYRLRCTGEGMKRLQSTTGPKTEGDIRLEMKSGNEGINDGSIFRYTKGGLKSCIENKFIDAYRFVADGANVPQVTFSAAANGAVGCYNIKIGERYIFGAGDYIDSGTGTPDNRAGYNWWLEEVETQAITYTYKVGETVLATQEEIGVVGLPYPAADVVLPLGYVATALEGNVVEGETAKDVACELNAEAIPFEYYDSYDAVEKWYYLNFAKNQNSLRYVADNAVLVDEETTPNLENWEAYAWAFIGTPATGFQVVNKKAGATKGLKAMKSDALTGGVVGEGAHTFKLTPSASIADVAGFYMAATNGETADRFNSQNVNEVNQMVYWAGADGGSTFAVSGIDFDLFLSEVKTAAVATLNNYASVSVIYSTSTAEAAEAVNAVELASNDLAGFNAAVEEIDAVVAGYRNTAYEALEDKYFTIHTAGRGNGYMQMTAVKVVGTAQAESPANLWQFVCGDKGTVNVYNPYTEKYLCEPQGYSAVVALTTEQENAGAYILNVIAKENAEAKLMLTSNGKSVHMDGSSNLVRWDDGDASEWQVTEVTDFLEVITRYKTVAISSMDEWKNLSVVFDASLIEAAEEAIGKITTTDWATFAAIDAELTKVTGAVAEKMFTFQTTATDNHRNGVWVSANATTGKAIGAVEQDYNAIWSLRHAGGVSFYLYNELNSVYMGAPSANCPLTETPVVAYTFEIINAETGIVEMHTNGETLHASNHDDDKLLNWDGDEAASRWKIAVIDVTKDIKDLLATIDEDDYAEVPALGQYPTAAYNALVKAGNTAETVEEVEHAIAAFKASLNKPVYVITSAWDGGYSAGAAIYYDGAWRWKKASRYDRQMWMTIPGHTQEEAPFVNAYDENGASYEVCDYLTGTVMRGKSVQFVQVPNWEGAYNLQYNADATSTDAAQHAQSDGNLVSWKPAILTDCQPSAWRVEYIGSTYELKDLTDEQLTALAETQTAFDSKIYLFDAAFGDGVGQYQGEEATIKEALFEVAGFLSLKLNVLKEKTVDEINAWTASLNNMPAATINLPAEGYYRIYGANSNVTPAGQYITGHTNADGGRIALTNDADASTIYYYADGKLQAYQSGKYIGLNSGHYVFATSKDDETHPASAIEFAASSYVAGAYTIKSADRYLHYKVYNGTVEIDRCQAEESANDSWFLEKLEKETITYTYKAGETVLATHEVKEFAGMPYPAANAVLPLGYTATLTGNIVKGETAKDIVCELNAEAIPFEYYDSYANVEQWYYLNFAKDQHFLFYAEDNTVLDVNKTAIDRTNREAYAWAFIGTPATGFQVVNKLAGADKGLKAMKSDALTGGVVGEGAHTFKLTASEHFTKGFYIAATNGESTERFNSQGGKMVYWGGADAGSTFTVAVCPFGAVAELEALIAEAEELKTVVDANTGDQIGEFSEETASALATAITTAQAKGNAATAEDVAVLQAVLDATKIILPTAGQYYQIHSSYFATTMAVYSNGSNAMWKALNSDDKSFYWKAVSTEDGGIALMNAFDEKYIQAGWSVADDAKNIAVKILAKTDAEGAAYEKGYRYGIFMNDGQMHANGHGNGAGTSGNLVNYGGGADGASSWYIVPVELPTFCTVTYNFNYEGDTKYTQSAELVAGAAYPAVQVPALPYGVTTDAATPEGTVTESKTFEFTLTVTEEFSLPFEPVAEGQPTKWYYTQMHAHVGYVFYISTNGDNLVWHGAIEDAAKYIADGADHDDYLWGFVGNIWDGFKMVNKAGKAVISTGNSAVTVGDLASATAFKAWKSQAGGEWFCMKHSTTNNYLNLNSGKSIIDHWSDNDNGSSILLTEPGKEYSLEIAPVGYSTYYSDHSLVIPETVEAYVVASVEDREVDLVQVAGVIPAHTGLILRGTGEHKFVASTAAPTAEIETNLLKGTTTKQLITPAEGTTCYVLANPKDGNGVGLYIASLNQNGGKSFYNNANKVYLPVATPVEQSARALTFRFGRGDEGTTEIDNSQLTIDNSQLIIYDLAGRRIPEIVEKGIYIVNGKKVVIR